MYLLRVISMKDCEQTHSTLNFIKVNACPDLHVSAGNNLHCSWRRLLVICHEYEPTSTFNPIPLYNTM